MSELLSLLALVAITSPFWRTAWEWYGERTRYQPKFSNYDTARQEIDQILSHAESVIGQWNS